METLLYDSCKEMGILLNKEQIKQFMQYKNLLLEWNKHINLTAITEEREIILKHFVDCISIISVIPFQKGASIIDVGTGAGFPGIPLKIVCKDTKVTLLDSLQKRLIFLEEVIHQLALENITCVHSRAEDSGKNKIYREKYDYCVSRAVANLAVLCEYCLPFVKIGGIFLALKGPDVEQEVQQSQKAIKVLGGEIVEIKQVVIPNTDLQHKIVSIKKVQQTPIQYPRKAGKAIKSPIK